MEVMSPTVVTEGTNVFLFFAVLLLPVLIFIFKHFKPSSSALKAPPLPPGPFPWPIIGNILQMGKKPHITLSRFAQSYGPLISLKLGTQILVVGSSPDAAMEILKTHDRILSGRHVPHLIPVKRPELNNLSLGMAFECNDRWKYLRTICRTELFSGKAIESQACLREKKVMDMVVFLGRMEGKEVKVGEVVFATTFNMLSNVLVARNFISLEDQTVDGGMNGLARAIMEIMTAPNLADFYPIFGGLDLQNLSKKFKEMCEGLLNVGAYHQRKKRKNR